MCCLSTQAQQRRKPSKRMRITHSSAEINVNTHQHSFRIRKTERLFLFLLRVFFFFSLSLLLLCVFFSVLRKEYDGVVLFLEYVAQSKWIERTQSLEEGTQIQRREIDRENMNIYEVSEEKSTNCGTRHTRTSMSRNKKIDTYDSTFVAVVVVRCIYTMRETERTIVCAIWN